MPRETNVLKATITIKGDKITSLTTDGTYGSGESSRYNNNFKSAISKVVVGKKLDSAKIGIVGGASLTSNAFNSIIDSVISKATK